MTRYPFGYTLAAITGVCAAFWLITLLYPIYAGAAALIIAASCGVLWLVVKVRRAFAFASHDLVDFVSGTTRPQPRNDAGQFDSPKTRMTAQLRAELAHRRNGGV